MINIQTNLNNLIIYSYCFQNELIEHLRLSRKRVDVEASFVIAHIFQHITSPVDNMLLLMYVLY